MGRAIHTMATMFEVVTGKDGQARCWWGASAPDYMHYHDNEWGFPVAEDRVLFEKLCLEGFQSGLSWITVLRKRDNFRAAFHDFDIASVAAMGGTDVNRLLNDAGIIRHRGKITATINNAQRTLELRDEVGSLAAFVWQFEPAHSDVANTFTTESTALSKELKRRGFTWVGPTTMYAFMQAMGLVNDHLEGCATRPAALRARRDFKPPSPVFR